MDPSSLASNTASLLALTIQIIGALHGHWDRESAPTVDRLLYELARLRATLASLEESSLQSKIPIVVGELPRVFRAIKNTLVVLGSKLLGNGETEDIPSHGELAMTWEFSMAGMEDRALPLSKSEGENVFNAFQVHIARLRASFPTSLASIADESSFRTSPEGLNLSSLWNSCAEYNEIHAASQHSRVEGSAVWLLSHPKFRHWLESDRIDLNRLENVLYCSGRPGSGKTILASAVIDELKSLRKQSTLGLAYFYFSYRNQTPVLSIVLTLLQQLYIQSPTVATEVRALEQRPPNAPFPSVEELTSVLVSVIARFRKAYIVLDALDECSSEHRLDLAALLVSLRSPYARLFVTTRPSHGLPDLDRCPDIPITPSSEDMRLFVRSRLKKLSERITTFDQFEKSKIEEALVHMGSEHGMFLLVELQLNSLFKASEDGLPRDFNLDQSLRKLTGDLNQVYDEQVDRIMAQQTADSNLAKHILSWLYYSTGSMPASALEHALREEVEGWEEKPTAPIDIRLVGKVCLDLVRFNRNTKAVVFFHFSLQEYLEEKHASNANLLIPPSGLAEACVRYLNHPDLGSPVSTPEKIRQRFRDHPFYEYAVKNWGRLLMLDGGLNVEALSLKLLLTDENRRLAVAEAIFRDETKFFQASENNRVSLLHFITYFGLLQSTLRPPSYVAKEEVHSRDFMSRTPIHVAAMMGHSVALEALFALLGSEDYRGIHHAITSVDALQRTVWHYAAEGNDPAVAKVLVEKLQLLNGRNQPNIILTRDEKNMTPLTYAAATGHLEVLELLLQRRLYNNDIGDALQTAIRGRHANVVEALLMYGASPEYGHMAAASEVGAMDIVKLLLEYGTEIEDQGIGSALHKAAQAGRGVILSNLIWNGANVEITDSKLRTPLSVAVEYANLEAVKALLEAGSDPEVSVIRPTRDNKASTVKAAVWAAEQGKADIFGLLRRAGADCSTALFPAIENGHYEIVQQLLNSGIVSELDDSLKARAVSLATEKGNLQIAYLLQNWRTLKHDAARHRWDEKPSDEDTNTKSHKSMRTYISNNPLLVVDKTAESADKGDDSLHQEPSHLSSSSSQSSETVELIDRDVSEEGATTTVTTELGFGEIGISVHAGLEAGLGYSVSPPSKPLPAVRVSTKPQPTGSKRSRTPFILIESPVNRGRIQLGSLVRDPNSPLQALVPSNQGPELRRLIPPEFIHELHQSDFKLQSEKRNTSSVGISFNFASAQASRQKESQIEMRAPHVWREQLSQHEGVLHRILSESIYGQEYVNFLRGTNEVFMVVGLFIMQDSEVVYGDGSDNAVGQPLIPVPGLEVQLGATAAQKSTRVATRYENGLIHGIQYRSVRLKTGYIINRFRSEHKRELQVEVGVYAAGRDYISLF